MFVEWLNVKDHLQWEELVIKPNLRNLGLGDNLEGDKNTVDFNS